MGLFQETAILAGDYITQPLRKFIAEKTTGMKFKIERKIERNSYIPSNVDKIVYEETVK